MKSDENANVTCDGVIFRSEDGGMEERPDRRPLHPAAPGTDPRGRLQEASPSLQEENGRCALGVSHVPHCAQQDVWGSRLAPCRPERLPVLKGIMMFDFVLLRKSTGTKVERLSLTQAEANKAANGRNRGRTRSRISSNSF